MLKDPIDVRDVRSNGPIGKRPVGKVNILCDSCSSLSDSCVLRLGVPAGIWVE